MSLVHTRVGSTFVFVPVSGSQLWLDASDGATITLNTGFITNWNDKSGNARNVVQPTPANAPTWPANVRNGLHAALFDPAISGLNNYMLDVTAAMMRSVSAFTFYIACKPTQNTVVTVPFVIGSGGTNQRFQHAQLTTGDRVGGRRNNGDSLTTLANSTVPPTAWTLISCVGDYNATTLTLYINGVQSAQTTSWLTAGSTPNDEGSLWVGANANLNSPFIGYIGDILFYPSAHAGSDLAANHAGLRAKWLI